jgi:transposase
MVRKMLQYAAPPGYQRQQPINRPMLGPWVGVIDAILEDDKQKPARQRHTAKRIFDRLQTEHGFTGGYTTIKNYVRGAHVRGREMFVPLLHPPGEAQVDFPPHKRRPVCGDPGLRRSAGDYCRRGVQGAFSGHGYATL